MSTRNFCGSGNIGVVAYSENKQRKIKTEIRRCLLYTSDAADEL